MGIVEVNGKGDTGVQGTIACNINQLKLLLVVYVVRGSHKCSV